MNRHLFLGIAVLVLATGQLLSPVISSFNDTQKENTFDPPIIPAGYTFSVWGIITLLGFLYGIYQLLPKRTASNLHLQLAPLLSAVYILFSIWLFAASNYVLWVCVIVFVTMFLLLFRIFQIIKANRNQLTKSDKILLEGQVGIYLGWCTIAIFANLASALAYYGFLKINEMGTVIQAIILILALLNGLYGVFKSQADYFLSGTIVWALVGVFFGLKAFENTQILQTVVIAALVIFISYFIYTKLKISKLNFEPKNK